MASRPVRTWPKGGRSGPEAVTVAPTELGPNGRRPVCYPSPPPIAASEVLELVEDSSSSGIEPEGNRRPLTDSEDVIDVLTEP